MEKIDKKLKSYYTVCINGKQERLHRYVMECFLERKLKTDEIVHHKDGNTHNNKISNLELTSRSYHKKFHNDVGINTRFEKKYDLHREDIIELYKNNSISYIAKKFGCSWNVIRRIIGNYKNTEMVCKICGETATYKKSALCSKHYFKEWYKNGKNK